MKVYAVVGTNWNLEYGYDEYSLPLEICSSKDQADQIAWELKTRHNGDYDDYVVEPYDIK